MWAGGFTWARLVALLFMVGTTMACIVRGSTRTRVKLRPNSRQIVVNGKVLDLNQDASLELGSTDTFLPASTRFPYEVRVIDGSTVRQVLLRSSLPNVLNDLTRLRRVWPLRVSVARGSNGALEQLVAEHPRSEIPWASACQHFSSPLREGQFRTAGIFSVIACMAAFVIVFLVTGQIGRGGPIGTLGAALALILVIAPAVIALHINLGKIRVHFDASTLRVECRDGLRRATAMSFEAKDPSGSWLLRNSDNASAEVLLLHNGLFSSVPVVGSAIGPWLAVFGQSDAPAQTPL